jgi:capsular exopolysaccharide synthesis family protein
MSKFLQALEQAEHDQALRGEAPAPAAQDAAAQDASPSSAEPVPLVETASPWADELPPELPPDVSEDLDEHLVSLLAPNSFASEQYRSLRHIIEQRHKASDLSIVAVSSPGTSDGKTTTAINLAGALAQGPDARILLVDGDLRKASMAMRLGLGDGGLGLVDAILDPRLSLPAVVRTLPHLNLSVVGAGRLPAAPYEVLKSPRLGELLAEARRRFDYIIIDTPPLVSVPDCRVIGKWVDGFLIVVTAHRTARKLLEEALKVTDADKVVGLVFNGDDRHLSRNAYTSRASSSRNGRRHFASSD